MGASSLPYELIWGDFEKNNTDDEHILNLGLCGKGLIETIRMNEKWENILDRKRLSHGARARLGLRINALPARPPSLLPSFLPCVEMERKGGLQRRDGVRRIGPPTCSQPSDTVAAGSQCS